MKTCEQYAVRSVNQDYPKSVTTGMTGFDRWIPVPPICMPSMYICSYPPIYTYKCKPCYPSEDCNCFCICNSSTRSCRRLRAWWPSHRRDTQYLEGGVNPTLSVGYVVLERDIRTFASSFHPRLFVSFLGEDGDTKETMHEEYDGTPSRPRFNSGHLHPSTRVSLRSHSLRVNLTYEKNIDRVCRRCWANRGNAGAYEKSKYTIVYLPLTINQTSSKEVYRPLKESNVLSDRRESKYKPNKSTL